MQTNLIDQGLNLMLFGMGTVFMFLTVLVFATKVMSALVVRFAPTPNEPQVAESAVNTITPSRVIVTAIQQAIAQHRKH